MSADRNLSPDQFDLVRSTPAPGSTLSQLHDSRYSREPEYMAALQADIEKNGFRNPVRTSANQDGTVSILDGIHRASVAYHLGIPLPTMSDDRAEDNRHSALWHKKARKIWQASR